MHRRILIVSVAYAAVILVTMVLFNRDADNSEVALAIWVVASLGLGATVGHWGAVALPLLGIPIALPFGSADRYLGNDAPQVWWFGIVGGAIAMLAAITGVAVHRAYERRKRVRANSV